jgi:hypothetical protein
MLGRLFGKRRSTKEGSAAAGMYVEKRMPWEADNDVVAGFAVSNLIAYLIADLKGPRGVHAETADDHGRGAGRLLGSTRHLGDRGQDRQVARAQGYRPARRRVRDRRRGNLREILFRRPAQFVSGPGEFEARRVRARAAHAMGIRHICIDDVRTPADQCRGDRRDFSQRRRDDRHRAIRRAPAAQGTQAGDDAAQRAQSGMAQGAADPRERRSADGGREDALARTLAGRDRAGRAKARASDQRRAGSGDVDADPVRGGDPMSKVDPRTVP